MSDAYVIGSFSTPFGKWTDKDHRVLARDAVLGVLEDAGLADGSALEQGLFRQLPDAYDRADDDPGSDLSVGPDGSGRPAGAVA